MVAPFAGAWIEMENYRGWRDLQCVAPFAGAWIEILTRGNFLLGVIVAPFAGAWIEILLNEMMFEENKPSLPSRERGLKYS